MTEKQDAIIRDKCYIPIDAEEFGLNELGIAKRDVLLREQKNSAVLRGGSETFKHIEQKGAFGKFFNWIKKEL